MTNLKVAPRFAVAAILMWVGAVVGPVRGGDEVAAWAPDDATFYLGVSNCESLAASVRKMPTWRKLDDPAIKDKMKPYFDAWPKFKAYLAGKLGLSNPSALDVLPTGGLTMWVSMKPGPGDPDTEAVSSAGLVMDMGDRLESAKTLAKTIALKSQEKGGQKETTESAGTQIVTLTFKPSSADSTDDDIGGLVDADSGLDPALEEIINSLPIEEMQKQALQFVLANPEPPEKVAFAFSGSKLILGSDRQVVEGTLRRLKRGGEGSMAQSSAMRTLRRHCDANSSLQMIINIPQITKVAAVTDTDFAKVDRGLAFSSLGPLVATIDLAPSSGVGIRFKGFMPVPGEPRGIAKLLMMRNRPTAPPPGIGEDTVIFASLNVNPAEVTEEVLQIAARIDPDQGEQMRAGMKMPQPDGSTLDLKADFLDHLTGPLSISVVLKKPYDAANMGAMIQLGHKSRAAIDKLVAMAPPGSFNPTQIMGATVYESSMVPITGLAMAVTDRTWIPVGTRGVIEACIRGEGHEGGGLGQDAEFKRIAQQMPKQCCAMMFGDGAKLFDAMRAVQKTGDVPEQPIIFGANVGDLIRWWVLHQAFQQESLRAEELRKYQMSSMFTMTRENDGLRFDGLTLVIP